MTESIDSLCPYCGVVCQVRYHLTAARIAWAEGIDGPSNRGRLCVKGRFGWDYAFHPDRLTVPLVRREDAPKTPNPANPKGQFREATWPEALDRAAQGFLAVKGRYGPDALGGFGTAKGSNEADCMQASLQFLIVSPRFGRGFPSMVGAAGAGVRVK